MSAVPSEPRLPFTLKGAQTQARVVTEPKRFPCSRSRDGSDGVREAGHHRDRHELLSKR
jgi:hypothetical protein